MFRDIESALKYIESRRVKRSLKQFKETIEKYGFNVHQKNMVHIAGTNGKGSTTNFIKNILIEHGYRVGTFTSPYLICHNDRICINGKMIDDEKLLEIINSLLEMIDNEQLSMFEIDTLIMLCYFNEVDLDFRIIETGIGGLNDKTNVIDSVCSAITNIGYDHQFMLGDTLEQIAYHKAGIIKENQICFTGETNDELVKIFETAAQIKNSYVVKTVVESDYQYPYTFSCLGHSYHLSNCGSYQGIKALVKTLHDQRIKNPLIIFSALGDKDIDKMKSLLSDYPLIQATFLDERLQLHGTDFKEVIQDNLKQYDNLIITGSLHFISIVRKYILTTLQD